MDVPKNMILGFDTGLNSVQEIKASCSYIWYCAISMACKSFLIYQFKSYLRLQWKIISGERKVNKSFGICIMCGSHEMAKWKMILL